MQQYIAHLGCRHERYLTRQEYLTDDLSTAFPIIAPCFANIVNFWPPSPVFEKKGNVLNIVAKLPVLLLPFEIETIGI